MRQLGLQITDFSSNSELNDTIMGYHALTNMTFERTNIYKIYETPDSQIYRYKLPNGNPQVFNNLNNKNNQNAQGVDIDTECPRCHTHIHLQASFGGKMPLKKNFVPYPVDTNKVSCPKCGTEIDLSQIRMQIEAQTRKKIV